jgi:pseudoazurin
MIPSGAQAWRGQIGQPVTVTFSQPGYYGYHCLPHRGLGMVGLVIVEGAGRDANLQSARSVTHPGEAKAVWEAIWAEALG